MKQHLGSLIKNDVIDAEGRICINVGIPNNDGTVKWSDINQDLNLYWYIKNPINGWMNFTRAQMMNGVVGINEIDILLSNEG